MAFAAQIAPEFHQLVEQRIDEEYQRAGFVKPSPDGTTEIRDDDKMKARTLQVVSQALVTSKNDRSRKAVTNGELFAAVFPEAPGAKPGTADQLDEIESEVRTALMRKVWGLTIPGPGGWIQKRLGEGSLILCRAVVLRKLDGIMAAYVTDDPTLIMEDSLNPQIDKLVRVASDVRGHASMIVQRHPELEQKVTTALSSGFNRVKAAAQLTSGSSNGTNGRKPADAEQE
jgi:hypothetical protein